MSDRNAFGISFKSLVGFYGFVSYLGRQKAPSSPQLLNSAD